MNISKKIKTALIQKDLNTVDLAKMLNCGTANLYNKYRRNNFSTKELSEIAKALNCTLSITFIDNETGKELC